MQCKSDPGRVTWGLHHGMPHEVPQLRLRQLLRRQQGRLLQGLACLGGRCAWPTRRSVGVKLTLYSPLPIGPELGNTAGNKHKIVVCKFIANGSNCVNIELATAFYNCIGLRQL